MGPFFSQPDLVFHRAICKGHVFHSFSDTLQQSQK